MQCQRPSPLVRIDMDGRFYCYGCAREMFFDPDLWKESIFFVASGLGDAFWSNLGTFPPWPTNVLDEDALSDQEDRLGGDDDVLPHLIQRCAVVGRTSGGMSIEKGGMSIGGGGMRTRGFAVAMSPGHPLCTQCKSPLHVQTPADGVVTASCARCGTSETYRAPPAAKGACPDLFGVISPEHVEGRETARVMPQQGSAALAVTCPKCGSALQLAPGARVTNCPYCKTTSVVPDHVASAGAPPPSTPDPFWLAFRSPSTLRTVLNEDAMKAQAPPPPPPQQQERASEHRSPQREERKSGSNPFAAIAGIIPVVLIIGAVLAFQTGALDSVLHKEKKAEGNHSSKDTPDPVSTKPPRSELVAIASCTCAFGDGQSTPQIALSILAPPSDGSKSWSLDIERTSGFVSEGRTARFPAQAGAVLPPLADAGAPAPAHMGIACEPGTFVLVADNHATGWSSVNGAWKWNATLPSPSIDAADAGATPTAGTDYAGGCVPLVVKSSSASLTLANGKHVSLSLKDGKVH